MKKRGINSTTLDLGDGEKFESVREVNLDETEIPKLTFSEVNIKRTKVDRQCWGCKYGFEKPTVPGQDPCMDELWATYADNKAHMSEEALSYLISEKHEKIIAQPNMMEKLEISECWLPEDVLTHLLYHMTDSFRVIQSDIKDCILLCASIKDCIYSKSGEQISHDYAAINTMIKLSSHKLHLLEALKKIA